MKKFLMLLLCTMLMFSFVACDEPEQPLPHEHSWDNGTVTTPATCTTEGVKTYECACGETKTEVIAMNPHTIPVGEIQCSVCKQYFVRSEDELRKAVDNEGAEIVITESFEVSETINLNKKVTITGVEGKKISSAISNGAVFSANAAGIVFDSLSFDLTYDGDGDFRVINIAAADVTVKNSLFTGKYNLGDTETSRGIVPNAGIEGYLIEGNTFKNLRQPAYLEGKGTVKNNTISVTRGWVVCQNHEVTFIGNIFEGENAEDIAIISNGIENHNIYTEETCLKIAAANNNCRIDQQIDGFRVENGEIKNR